MTEELDFYLQPTYYIESDSEVIRSLVEKIAGEDKDPTARAVKLFTWARDQIRYNPFSPMMERTDFPATTVIARGAGFCIQKAIVLAALCRAADIPCGLGFADIRSHKVSPELKALMGTDLFVYHGYNRIFLDGRWVKATCAFDIKLCRKMDFIPVEFDGKNDSVLHAVDINGDPHIDYLRHIGDYADFPFEDFLPALQKAYGDALARKL